MLIAIDIDAVLRELEAFGYNNDAATGTDRSRKMLNLERDSAALIHILLLSAKRTRVLEIGTSNGYSAIWIAAALVRTGGRLVSIEREPGKSAAARRNLMRVGLADRVELVVGEATHVVAELEGPFDCVFFDADRVSAPDQLTRLLPKLTADVLLLADNALSHPDEIAGYIRAVEALQGFASATLPIGKGLHVACRS